MPRHKDSLSVQVRDRAPYRALCCELLIQLARDQRHGRRLTERERQGELAGARRFARYLGLPGVPSLLRSE